MSRFRYSPLAWHLFDLAFGFRMRLGVERILMAGLPRDLAQDRPLLLVANHVSWWDGFILRRVHQALRPKGALYTVMLERELAKRPFLQWLGGVGFHPGSLASFRALLADLKSERDREPDLSILFFPQGMIWPSHRRPLGFAGGVRLVVEALAPATVLPVGIHLWGGNRMAGTAFVSVGEPMGFHADSPPSGALERAVEMELDRIQEFLAIHGELAMAEWPREGDRLPGASMTEGVER